MPRNPTPPETEAPNTHDATAAEEAARDADEVVLTPAEKVRLAAEASRDEDA